MIIIFIIGITVINTLILNNGWQFKYKGHWYNTTVPSTNLMDLIDHQLIIDPFINYAETSWNTIEQYTWTYQNILNHTACKATITFQGLDTYASVYFNSKLILEADNMFRTWSVYVEEIPIGSNLTIIFKSALTHDVEQQEHNSIQLQLLQAYSRKASYQYGWDICPKIIQVGIWKPIIISELPQSTITSTFVQTKDISDNKALLSISISITNLTDNMFLQFVIMILEQKVVFKSVPVNNHTTNVEVMISQPMLWWPISYGSQHIYTIVVDLFNGNNFLHQTVDYFGIRTAIWQQVNDVNGTSFTLQMNGRNIYMKGANYLPPDMSLPRALRDNKYTKLFKDIIAADFNSLRLWGGTSYENSVFYELADQHGILIWHDLMFANTIYPADDAFINQIKAELTDNISRLRNHPSIVLWAGNNEIKTGLKQWGWANRKGADKWANYRKLFIELIPSLLQQLDPSRFYLETTPSGNLTCGDVHMWDSGSKMFSINDYYKQVGRFNSEYGMQALPELASIQKFIPDPPEQRMNSTQFISHQRSPKAQRLLEYIMDLYMFKRYDLLGQIYNSNVVQYMAIRTAIEAHRFAKPYNMGTLYWQLNDVWPGITWSSIDYYGCPKGGYYAAKQSFTDPLIGVIIEQLSAKIFITHELNHVLQGHLVVQLFNFTNNSRSLPIQELELDVSLDTESSHEVATMIVNNTLYAFSYLLLNFTTNIRTTVQTYTFHHPNYLQLQKPIINVKRTGNTVELLSDVFAKHVYIYNKDICVHASDNYFDLVPMVPKMITIDSDVEVHVLSLFDMKD